MNTLRQICSITLINLYSIPSRFRPCLVAVVGIAGTVAVLIFTLALAESFERATEQAGRTDRAIVLAKGSMSEATSSISRSSAARLMSLPGIRIAANGKAIASADRLAFIALPDRRTQLDSIVTIRGIDLAAFTLRPEIRITKGRNYHPGTREVIVGRAALRRVAGLEIGNLLTPGEWLVVGSFESNGDARESEILADGESLALALSASSINSITLMLEHAGALSAFRDALTADPTLPVVVRRESDYFSEASADTRRALRGIGYLVGGIMALGAIVTMLSTMFSVVSKRTGEIATLRAIGFSPGCIAASVLLEILLLAAFGAAIGTCMAWLFFDGNSVSILSSASPAQITYSLAVSDMLVLTSATCAFLVAVFAGSFPALRAARLPIAAALRAI